MVMKGRVRGVRKIRTDLQQVDWQQNVSIIRENDKGKLYSLKIERNCLEKEWVCDGRRL